MGPSPSGSFVYPTPSSPLELLRQRLFRRLQTPADGKQTSLFGRTLHQWMATNCWNPQQLSRLIQLSSQNRLQASAIEISNILTGVSIDIQSRFFRSLASVHQGIPTDRSSAVAPATVEAGPENLLLAYAVPITTDRCADQASWWFALYCDEAWASAKLNPPLPMPALTGLSMELSYLVRQSIVGNRLDPVLELQRLSQQFFPRSRAKSDTFRNWSLGMSAAPGDELHETIHLIMHIVNSYDSSVRSIDQLLRTAAEIKTQRVLEGWRERQPD